MTEQSEHWASHTSEDTEEYPGINKKVLDIFAQFNISTQIQDAYFSRKKLLRLETRRRSE